MRKYILYSFDSPIGELLAKHRRFGAFHLVGGLDLTARHYRSFLAGHRGFVPVTAKSCTDVVNTVDGLLFPNPCPDPDHPVWDFCAQARLGPVFTHPSPDAVRALCEEKGLAYTLLSPTPFHTGLPTLYVRRSRDERHPRLRLDTGLGTAAWLEKIGYSTAIRTGEAALDISNRDDSPMIMVDVSAGPAGDDGPVLSIDDVLVTDHGGSPPPGITGRFPSLQVVYHEICHSRKRDDAVYLNFLESDHGEVYGFLRTHLCDAIPLEQFLRLSQDRFNLYGRHSCHLFQGDVENLLYLSAARRAVQLDDDQRLVVDLMRSDELVTAGTGRIGENRFRRAVESVNRLLAEDNLLAIDFLARISTSPAMANRDRKVVSFLGGAKCNMQCAYCFSRHGEGIPVSDRVGPETVEKALDFVISTSSPPPKSIQVDYLMDSEPLLRFDDYMAAVEACRRAEKKWGVGVHAGFLTNGTLLGDDVIRVFDADLRWLGFSLDGDRTTHDAVRRMPDGTGSYDRILGGVRKVLSLGWSNHPGVSVVLTAGNLDVFSVFKHLWELGFRVIIIRPVRARPNEEFFISADHYPLLESSYRELTAFLLDSIRAGSLECVKAVLYDTDYLGRFLVRTLHNTRAYVRHCGAGESMLSFRANGDMYACDSLNAMGLSRLGSVSTGRENDWHIPYVTDIPMCRECWARFLCGGPCRHLLALDPTNEVVSLDCRLIKFLIGLSFEFWHQAAPHLTEDDRAALVAYVSRCNGIDDHPSDNHVFAHGPR